LKAVVVTSFAFPADLSWVGDFFPFSSHDVLSTLSIFFEDSKNFSGKIDRPRFFLFGFAHNTREENIERNVSRENLVVLFVFLFSFLLKATALLHSAGHH